MTPEQIKELNHLGDVAAVAMDAALKAVQEIKPNVRKLTVTGGDWFAFFDETMPASSYTGLADIIDQIPDPEKAKQERIESLKSELAKLEAENTEA